MRYFKLILFLIILSLSILPMSAADNWVTLCGKNSASCVDKSIYEAQINYHNIYYSPDTGFLFNLKYFTDKDTSYVVKVQIKDGKAGIISEYSKTVNNFKNITENSVMYKAQRELLLIFNKGLANNNVLSFDRTAYLQYLKKLEMVINNNYKPSPYPSVTDPQYFIIDNNGKLVLITKYKNECSGNYNSTKENLRLQKAISLAISSVPFPTTMPKEIKYIGLVTNGISGGDSGREKGITISFKPDEILMAEKGFYFLGIDSYKRLIHSRINDKLHCNFGNVSFDTPVRVHIKLDSDGKILDYQIKKSSGLNQVDSEITSAIKKAMPFPKLPNDFKQDTIELVLVFTESTYAYSNAWGKSVKLYRVFHVIPPIEKTTETATSTK